MTIKSANVFELDLQPSGVFLRCWPLGQFHLSRLGFFAARWSSFERYVKQQPSAIGAP